MAEGVQAMILCEDLQSFVFIRRALEQLGYNPRRVRYVPYPDSQGSGEQHVRERYPVEVNAHRSRAARTKAVLVVHTDADRLTVEERHLTLAEALSAVGYEPRGKKEAIALLVPKWEMETWLHFLLSEIDVDEGRKDYPKFKKREADTHPAADKFVGYLRGTVTAPHPPPSMARGLIEAGRIPA